MFQKIFSSLSLANALKSLLFKRISSPLQSTRLISFALELKSTFTSDESLDTRLFKALEKANAFKKERPEDFDALFEILKELLDEFDKDPNAVKESLKGILR